MAALATIAALTLCGVAALALRPAVAAAEECPNAAFRTGASAHLPDCRAYELVTPPFKNNALVAPEAYGPEGNSLFLVMTAATAGLEGFPHAALRGPEAYYSISRTASGWTTMPDDPPSSEYLPYYYTPGGAIIPEDFGLADRDGLTTAWLERGVHQPENGIGIFLRLPDGSIAEVGDGLPPATPPGSVLELAKASVLHVEDISADGSRVLFTLRGDRWPFDPTTSGESLYEYSGTGNSTPLLVGVNQTGALISGCGTELGSGLIGGNQYNALSADGRTIFFTARCGARVEKELYARIDNGEAGARTVDISEPSREDCAACDTEVGTLASARFEGASEDGTSVLFSTRQPLLGGATGLNFYEYNFDAPAGERIVRVSGGASEPQLPVQAHPLISADGSHVYFIAKAVLTGGANEHGEVAEAGAENLYVFAREAGGGAGRVAFVAKLSAEDAEQWGGTGGDVTPDGSFLVFTSERDLTPDDTSHGVRQAFEYDTRTGALIRVSIGENGFNHDGNVPPVPPSPGVVRPSQATDAAVIVTPASTFAGYPSRSSVSANGEYVFFQSTVGLTPEALDRKPIDTYVSNHETASIYANNIYEYHAGRVSLISDGQDLSFSAGSDVQLVGADESGRDVFFTTSDRLVAQDTDTSTDVYDARVDGGFPAPAVSAACEGEACQGRLSGAPTLLSPGSEFQAGGNPPLAASAVPAPAKVKAKAPKKTRKKKAKRSHGGRARRASLVAGAERKGGRR